MPSISLVICVHAERDLLDRLLRNSEGCYDELVVVHDGPDTTNVRSLIESMGGRFFERPREFQQEPHWPFAWGEAKHDWILRLDADEIPSIELKKWLQNFRAKPEPQQEISGFTCIWPLWNGKTIVSKKWPAGRNFLFHKLRVRFFGMVEQVPIADVEFVELGIVLEHRPLRKSFGFRNLIVRKQAFRWRECIARSLLGKPSDLPCWRWNAQNWPVQWEQIRRAPVHTALRRLTIEPLRNLRSQWRTERRFFPVAALCAPIHHALICVEYWKLSRKRGRKDQTSI